MFKNGFCNDEVNHIDCGFDGGDCCFKPKGTDIVNEIAIYIVELLNIKMIKVAKQPKKLLCGSNHI